MPKLIDNSIVLLMAGLFLVGWLVFSVLYIKKYTRKGALLQILLLFIAVLALAGILINPAVLPYKTDTWLLQKGYVDVDVLDSLLQNSDKSQYINLNKAEDISLSYALQKVPIGSKMLVTGNGIETWHQTYLADYNWQYYPPEKLGQYLIPTTSEAVVMVADTLNFSGLIHEPVDEKSTVKLLIDGVEVDSIQTSESYSLNFIPKSPGLYKAKVVLTDKNKSIIDYSTSTIQVYEADKLKIALLTDYPSAESKYLKEFLAGNGHAVYYQAELAPGISQKSSLNKPPVYSFNSLNKFDLLVLSVGWWNKYARQINGLAKQNKPKAVLVIDGQVGQNVILPETGNYSVKLKKQPGSVANYLFGEGKNTQLTEQLMLNKQANWAVARYFNTYSNWLQGNEEQYQNFWHLAIRQLVSKQLSNHEALVIGQPKNKRPLTLLAPDSVHFVVSPLGDTLNSISSANYTVNFTPREAGTYTLTTDSTTVYVEVDSVNSAIQRASKYNQLKKIADWHKQQMPSNDYRVYKPISTAIYFIIFIFAVSLLWVLDRWYA